MSQRVRITLQAYADLRAIAHYTRKRWGAAQARRYLQALDAQFAALAAQPGLGRPRPDVAEGYHSCPCGRHLVFYLVRGGGIDIIGVPHQSMDVEGYFGED